MFRLSHRTLACCSLLLVALPMGACDQGKKATPEIVEVPVPVATSAVSVSAVPAASAATTALTEPKRYGEEREHKGAAKVRIADLALSYEAKAGALAVTKLPQGTEVTRLVDFEQFSLVEYPDGATTKQGWVASEGIEDTAQPAISANAVSAAPSGAATSSHAAPAAQASAVTSAKPAASAKPASSAQPAASAKPAPASSAHPTSATSAAPAASARPRRGRLGR